jgi:uncharacterized protein YqhQ
MRNFFKFLRVLPLFAVSCMSKKNKVGGQAIIEGVMMRGKQKISWAVRKQSGEMVVERFPFVSLVKKNKFYAFPVVRGAVNLYESLKIGYKALMRSAEIAMPEEEKPKEKNSRKESISMTISMLVALVVSLGLFMYLPMFISQLFFKNTALSFNFVAGTIRLLLFFAYLVGISFWKDMRRVFEYHGAEHKAIFTYEDEKELTIENMKPYSTLHPRCGTSFLLLVAIVCILLFSIIDAVIIHFIGPYPHVMVRFLVHVLLIPVVGGFSYEILKLSDRYQNVFPVSLLIKPGLWLQLITTKQPDDKQLLTAAAALNAAV